MYERDNEGEKELRGMEGMKIASIITRSRIWCMEVHWAIAYGTIKYI